MIKNKLTCDDCYKVESVNCGLCKKPVEGDCLTSNGQNFHSECMNCSDCGIPLRGRYYSFKDQFICEKDYKKNEKNCHDCGELIKGPYYTVNSEKVICEKDYKEEKKLGLKQLVAIKYSFRSNLANATNAVELLMEKFSGSQKMLCIIRNVLPALCVIEAW